MSNNAKPEMELDSYIRLVSCNSEWVIDEARKLYLRVPRDVKPFNPRNLPRNLWSEYSHFTIDEEKSELVLYLNAECSRIIKAHLHTQGHGQCGEDHKLSYTIEMSQLKDGLSS